MKKFILVSNHSDEERYDIKIFDTLKEAQSQMRREYLNEGNYEEKKNQIIEGQLSGWWASILLPWTEYVWEIHDVEIKD